MKQQQSGFTLIELVMVIVILGVLAVSAIPKFTDVSSAAEQAATDGVAGALGSGSAINYAVRSLTTANGVAVVNCAGVGATVSGGTPTGYAITSTTATNPITAGQTDVCRVTHTASSKFQDFTGHAIN